MAQTDDLSKQPPVGDAGTKVDPTVMDLLTRGLKKPIFIGTNEVSIAEVIEKLHQKHWLEHTGQSDYPYQVFMISPLVYQKLYENFLFNNMAQEEQQSQLKAQRNAQAKETAYQTAVGLREKLRYAWNFQGDEEIVFCETELRSALTDLNKGKFSHQETWALMDFLTIQGYLHLLPGEEERNREKRKYKLVIETDEQLKYLSDNMLLLEAEIKTKQTMLADLKARYKKTKRHGAKRKQSQPALSSGSTEESTTQSDNSGDAGSSSPERSDLPSAEVQKIHTSETY